MATNKINCLNEMWNLYNIRKIKVSKTGLKFTIPTDSVEKQKILLTFQKFWVSELLLPLNQNKADDNQTPISRLALL